MTATTQRPRIYIETSIVSYLTARDSSSLLGAARQLLTRRWWESRDTYDVFISDVVLRECRAGDSSAAMLRLESLKGIDSLSVTPSVVEVAESLLEKKIIPEKAAEDALHIAVATVHNMDFLLTWNCKHIANPIIQAGIAEHLNKRGLLLPFICTPEELSGEDYAR